MKAISERKLKVIEELQCAARFAAIGLLLFLGYRAGEWLVPKPAAQVQVLVCMADEAGTVKVCRDLDQLVKKHDEENHENR